MSAQDITASRYISKLSQEEVDLILRVNKTWHRSALRVWDTYCTINIDGNLSKFKDHELVLVIDMTGRPYMKILGSMHGTTQVNGMTSIIARHEIKVSYIGVAIVKINDHYALLVDYDFTEKERIRKIEDAKTKEEDRKRKLNEEYEKLKKELKEKDREIRLNEEYENVKRKLKEGDIEIKKIRLEIKESGTLDEKIIGINEGIIKGTDRLESLIDKSQFGQLTRTRVSPGSIACSVAQVVKCDNIEENHIEKTEDNNIKNEKNVDIPGIANSIAEKRKKWEESKDSIKILIDEKEKKINRKKELELEIRELESAISELSLKIDDYNKERESIENYFIMIDDFGKVEEKKD